MLYGFEEQTAELNAIERNAAGIIANCLQHHHIGKEKAVTGQAISDGLAKTYTEFRTDNGKPYLNGARVRKIINYIRTQNLCPRLIANSNGYYVCNDRAELTEYINSLRARANAIQAVADKLAKE